MSFDIQIRRHVAACAHCGRGAADEYYGDLNLTHNVNGIVDRCLISAGAPLGERPERYYLDYSWGRLDGWRVEKALPILERAHQESLKEERQGEFRALEPANGWGTLESVREVFGRLLDAARQAPPDAIITAEG